MTPEEFYHLNKGKLLTGKETMFEMRVKSLAWMLGCFEKGTIRKQTIINLIPLDGLFDLLEWLEEKERYEDCLTVKTIIDKIYKPNKKK
jgi:hypothetical protein|tara:strand:- start:289 stop:555 length:267 start_codon:yes stop_codon:yes gene_type:complete